MDTSCTSMKTRHSLPVPLHKALSEPSTSANKTWLDESVQSDKVDRPYQVTAVADFLKRVAQMSPEEKRQVLTQPKVLDLLITKETLQKLDVVALHKLVDVVENVIIEDPIDDILTQYPRGEPPVGNFNVIVELAGYNLDNFRRGQWLTNVAMRAAIASQKEPIPANVFLGSEDDLGVVRKTPFPVNTDTILFPVRLEVSDGHWVLVVIRLFSFPTGKTYQFSVYNSNKLSRYLPMLGKLAIEPVLVHVSKVLPKKEWKYARKDVECATHQNMEDSGIAVIDNAISVIYGTEMQSDMGAVACYTRREKYARQCLQSANTNIAVLARAAILRLGLSS